MTEGRDIMEVYDEIFEFWVPGVSLTGRLMISTKYQQNNGAKKALVRRNTQLNFDGFIFLLVSGFLFC